MIDFRYHLVSIVSIFLALAVGIVLGAGPLKEDIGNRLTEQTTSLRAEKNQLRTELDVERKSSAAGDTFLTNLQPAIVRDRLSGKTIALIVAPGADADLVKNTTAALLAAGAKVGSTITLGDIWADPAKKTFRNNLTGQIAELVKAPLTTNNPDQLAAAVLSRAVLGGTDLPTQVVTPSATTALESLKTGDLIKVAPDKILPSSSALFLGGPIKGSNQQDTDSRLTTYLELVRALDGAGSGAVAATSTNTTDRGLASDLVAAVRKDSDASKVATTVDDADLPMGQITLVLALAEQYSGGHGHYGLASDAKAIAPEPAAKQ